MQNIQECRAEELIDNLINISSFVLESPDHRIMFSRKMLSYVICFENKNKTWHECSIGLYNFWYMFHNNLSIQKFFLKYDFEISKPVRYLLNMISDRNHQIHHEINRLKNIYLMEKGCK